MFGSLSIMFVEEYICWVWGMCFGSDDDMEYGSLEEDMKEDNEEDMMDERFFGKDCDSSV